MSLGDLHSHIVPWKDLYERGGGAGQGMCGEGQAAEDVGKALTGHLDIGYNTPLLGIRGEKRQLYKHRKRDRWYL